MGIFRISRLATLGAAASAALLLVQPVGAANLGVGVVVGQGTISPALTMSPQPVTGGFAGSAVGGGVVNTTSPIVEVAPNGCSFSFASTGAGDDLNTGQGTASGACNGTASLAATTLGYSRTGPVVVITGTGTANGVAASYTSVCLFIPTSAPAVGSFALACGVLIQ